MYIDNITSNGVSLNSAGKSMQIEVYEKEIERLNNIIKEVRNELNDFNESYLIDEGCYGVYNLIKEIIDKLDKGSE